MLSMKIAKQLLKDVLNIGDLEPAIERADVVYANLRNPEITQQAKNIVSLMENML